MKLRSKDTKPTIVETAERLASAIAREDPRAAGIATLYKNVERLKGQTIIDARVDLGSLVLVTKDLTEYRFDALWQYNYGPTMTITEAKCPCCFGRGDRR